MSHESSLSSIGSLSGICQGTKVVYNKNIIKVNELNKERIKSEVPIDEKCAQLMTVSEFGTEEVYGY